jgi:hypothetical protein
MRYVVHYNTRHTVVLDCVGKPSHEDLRARAVWQAKNHSGRADIELVQVLPEGVPSELLKDKPPEPPEPPTLPKPPAPPGTPHSGDLMLARAA